MASGLTRVTPLSFELAMLGSYWITNMAGFLLMYIGGKKFTREQKWRTRDAFVFIGLSTLYTAAVYLLAHYHIVSPLF